MGFFSIGSGVAASGSIFNFRLYGSTMENGDSTSTGITLTINNTSGTTYATSHTDAPTSGNTQAHPWVLDGFIRWTSSTLADIFVYGDLGFGAGGTSNAIQAGSIGNSLTVSSSNIIGFNWQWSNSSSANTVTTSGIYVYQVA
jgi:hypothetical protein